jgi:hypothetical protein
LTDNQAVFTVMVSGNCTPPATSARVDVNGNHPTYGGNTSSGTTFTPCINTPSNAQTVTTTLHVGQYFLMNVIQGLTYQVYTNASPAVANALRLKVFDDANPLGSAIASSIVNTGTRVATPTMSRFVHFARIRTSACVTQQQND